MWVNLGIPIFYCLIFLLLLKERVCFFSAARCKKHRDVSQSKSALPRWVDVPE